MKNKERDQSRGLVSLLRYVDKNANNKFGDQQDLKLYIGLMIS